MESVNADVKAASTDPYEALRERRRAVFALGQGATDASGPEDAGPFCALALSGGGIRSATFSLGVIQAIALSSRSAQGDTPATTYPASLLSSIDYLSTVSGGGYVGGFLSSLFLPGRLQTSAAPQSDATAADNALQALSVEPPGRIHADRPASDADWVRFPLAWLRDNGRYLSPTGAGDMAYDIALAIRNWIAVQYVIGTIFVMAFALLAVLRGPFWLLAALADLPVLPIPPLNETLAFEMWWGPTAYLPLATFLLWACPTGLAYWWAARQGPKVRPSAASLGTLLLVVLLYLLSRFDPMPARVSTELGFAVLLFLSLLFYGAALASTAVKGEGAEVAQRVLLTRWLRAALMLTAALTVLAVLEALGQSIYLYWARGGTLAALVTSLGTAGVLTLLVKRFATLVSGLQVKGLTSRIPLMTLAGAAGVVIILCVALSWSFAFAWVLWGGEMPFTEPSAEVPLSFLVVGASVFGLAFLTGLFPGFINLSSLQTLYASRLTRAYLGASNGQRCSSSTNDRDRSAAEPVQDDDVDLAAFLDATGRPRSLAPLHLINVTLNSTVDPAEQLVQRDRKGLPMAIAPTGCWIDGKRFDFAASPTKDIDRTPSVGKWVSTSGAALSTGLGRQTSLGLSLLLGAANVRLGTWWNCPGASQTSDATGKVARLGRFLFTTQSYLADELQARFFGLRRDWQYLSDGGHFENIALYEMLRPARRVGFAFATDGGADGDYQFSDLATLIRLVRIDFGIELEVDTSAPDNEHLGGLFGVPEEFRRWIAAQRAAGAATGHAGGFTRRAVLLKARFPGQPPHCWVVLFKPVVTSDASADVIQYSLANPDFPQQSTADQFFDEAQWESHRKLGIDNALKVLDPTIRAALRDHTHSALI